MAKASIEERQETSAASPVETQQPARPAVPQTEVVVDEAGAHEAYANFARVTGTPEEVIVDFALNPQPFAVGRQEVKVSQRLIMNFYTAKRLLGALQMTIQRHEAAFGSVELDVRRRANLPSVVTPPRPESKIELPVRVYLSVDNAEQIREVSRSVHQLASVLGFDLIEVGTPRKGSWIQEWIAKSRAALNQKEVQERLQKVERAIQERLQKAERALELKVIDKVQADVDETLAKAVSTLLQSLDKIPNAAVQIETVLLLKTTNSNGVPNVVVKSLTQKELGLIRDNPRILDVPERTLQALSEHAGASGASGFQLKQPVSN